MKPNLWHVPCQEMARRGSVAVKRLSGHHLLGVPIASNRRHFIALGGAAAAGSALASCSLSSRGGSASASAEVVEHLWVLDGRDGFANVAISKTGAAPIPNVLTPRADRGRIASKPGATAGNDRECWLREGTEWADSEVTSLWYPPSVMDERVCTPQMGHVHRVSEKNGTWSAVVVDQNVFSFEYWTTYVGVWSWGKGGFRIGSHHGLAGHHWGYPYVRGVQRTNTEVGWLRHFVVDRLCGVQEGDRIDVAGCEDESFNGKNLLVHGATAVPSPGVGAVGPTIYVVEPRTKRAVGMKSQLGYVQFARPEVQAINPRVIYPMWVTSRVVGSTVMLKKWSAQDLEPTWGDPQRTLTFELKPEKGIPVPTSGSCGILSNHLRNGAWMEYGDVLFAGL